jgi:hypothetical protein
MKDILERARLARIRNEQEREQEELIIQQENTLAEAIALGASEEQLLQIRRYYGDLAFNLFLEQQQRLKNEREKSNKQDVKTTEVTEEQKLAIRQRALGALAATAENISSLLGEQTAAGKAFGVASATIDTYVAANAILKDPALVGQPFARFALMAATITSGLLNVKRILSVDETGKSMAGGGVGGAAAPPPPAEPDFNIVGASPTNQLAQTIATAEQQPLRAFVVSDDVTTAQQLDRNIIEGASLG